MLGVHAKNPGGPEQLELIDVAVPKPRKGEILIKVHAAALNRTDIITREGKMSYLQNPILGVEVSGTVIDSNGTNFVKDEKVAGLVNGGGYAEYAVMPAERAMRIPDSFTFEEGAAIPEVFLTAYQTLFWHGRLQRRESVLIHAGGSGVGTAAIQLAKQITGAKVMTTAGSKEKLAVCKELGADVLINYKEESFDHEVLKATENQGANVILDFIGAKYWEMNTKSISQEGRWVLIGTLGGSTVEKMNLMTLMSKCVQITGTLLTPRSDQYKADLTKEFMDVAMPLFKQNKIKPIIDRAFSFQDVQKAHQHMEDNKNIGKIILTWD
ncbi:NAD(P)H-quinone oxidoreductase [Virgibacillus halophilus]|uniref:NAD(P)H-quinone oxidoreductase n=1 Tax=Tigheibacillus halophilus TaxID=361280 RepID=UPI0036443CCD